MVKRRLENSIRVSGERFWHGQSAVAPRRAGNLHSAIGRFRTAPETAPSSVRSDIFVESKTKKLKPRGGRHLHRLSFIIRFEYVSPVVSDAEPLQLLHLFFPHDCRAWCLGCFPTQRVTASSFDREHENAPPLSGRSLLPLCQPAKLAKSSGKISGSRPAQAIEARWSVRKGRVGELINPV